MKKIVLISTIFIAGISFGQVMSPDCSNAENVCSDNGTTFPLNSINNPPSPNPTFGTDGWVNDLPPGLNVSNPGFGAGPNNGNPNTSGCLNSSEQYPNWFVINISSDGILEFTIGGASGGFYDWALWPYYENPNGTSACNDITNNTLAPVACNWNQSSMGYTGMTAQGFLPGGATQGNFEYGIPVNAGEAYVLCFSNYSNTNGNATLIFGNDIPGNNNPNTAGITCQSVVSDQTICLGEDATVNINVNPQIQNSSVNWLVTTGVSDPTESQNVTVSITQTTTYQVEILENGTPFDTVEFTITVVPPPAPNAGTDDIICLGQPIALDGTVSDPANTYGWTVNTNGIIPTPSVNFSPNSGSIDPTVVVNQPGTYTFTLTEDNGVCPAETDDVDVLVSTTIHTTTWTGPSCAGMSDGSITITNPDAVEYSFDGGVTWVTNATQSGFGVGTYPVRSRNGYGCEFGSSVTIQEPDQLYVYGGNDTLICENGTATLWADISAQGLAVTYHWSHDPGTTNASSISPLANTTVSVYAEGPNGCLSDTVDIQVDVRPGLSGTISAYDTICPGYPTTIGVAGLAGGIGAPYDISWDSGETGSGSGMDIEVNPPATQTYTATITDACESTPLVLTTEVYVAPVPVPMMSVVDPAICEPAVFEVSNMTDPAMVSSYYWILSDGQTYADESPFFTEEMYHGSYDVQLVVTSPLGCIDSITNYDFLTVYQKPEAQFTWSPNPVKMFNTEVVFSNQTFLGHEYYWTFNDGVPGYSMLERPTVQFPDGVTGDYDVTLYVTSEHGCMDTITRTLTVLPEVLIFAPTAFTPDGDEWNQTWKVHLEGIDSYSFTLTVYNRWGEMIWESHDPNVGWDGTYGGKLAPAGMYSWKIEARDAVNDGKYEWQGHFSVLR